MSTDTDHLLRTYRDRLRAASIDLPPAVRDELLDDVDDHLAQIRSDADTAAATHEALERLGTPEQVAAAARAEAPGPDGGREASPPPRGRVRALDVVAVILLLIGGLFPPVLGWIVGAVLLWASTTWTTREKLLGTFVLPGGLALVPALGLLAVQTCTSAGTVTETGEAITTEEVCTGTILPDWATAPILVLAVVLPVVVAVTLLRRARERA